MNKYDTYYKVRECLLLSSFLAHKSDEGRLIVAVICQAIKDAMGLYDSDKERVYVSNDGMSRGKRKFITRQDEALGWLRSKEHYPFCKLVRMRGAWVDHLLTTKCGVEL